MSGACCGSVRPNVGGLDRWLEKWRKAQRKWIRTTEAPTTPRHLRRTGFCEKPWQPRMVGVVGVVGGLVRNNKEIQGQALTPTRHTNSPTDPAILPVGAPFWAFARWALAAPNNGIVQLKNATPGHPRTADPRDRTNQKQSLAAQTREHRSRHTVHERRSAAGGLRHAA